MAILTGELAERVRDLFVQGEHVDGKLVFPSLKELASRHGVSTVAIYARSKKERWGAQRDGLREEARARRDEARLREMVDEGRKLDRSCLRLAKKALEAASAMLSRGGLEAGELVQVNTAIKTAQGVARLALGEAQSIREVKRDDGGSEAYRRALERLDRVVAARAGDAGSVH